MIISKASMATNGRLKLNLKMSVTILVRIKKCLILAITPVHQNITMIQMH